MNTEKERRLKRIKDVQRVEEIGLADQFDQWHTSQGDWEGICIRSPTLEQKNQILRSSAQESEF